MTKQYEYVFVKLSPGACVCPTQNSNECHYFCCCSGIISNYNICDDYLNVCVCPQLNVLYIMGMW